MNPDVFNQLELARKYHELGLQLVPLPIGEKAARKRWKHTIEKPQTPDDIALLFGLEKKNTAIYSGPESGNFATIDIDRPELWGWACQNIPHFVDIASRTLSCKSGGRGGVHLGIRTEKPIENATFRNPKRPDEKGGDIIARNGYALYPRSEVRGGEYEMLFDDFGGIIDLDITDPALKDFVRCFNLRSYTEPEPLPDRTTTTGIIYKNGKPWGLSLKAWGLLTRGSTAGLYQSPSEADQAIITECVLKGWNVETVKELFRRHTYRDKPKNRPGYIEHSYLKAEKYLSQNKNQVDHDIDQLHALVNSWPWKGQGGRVDRDVTRSLLEIARRRRSLKAFGASIRELAEMSGISEGPTHRALQRNPFIIDSQTNGITCTFTVQAPAQPPCELNVPVCKSEGNPPCELNVPVLQFGEPIKGDVFRWQGLGKAGADIYRTLLQHGESDIKALSQRAGVNIVTVYRKLNDLERCGLLTIKKQGRQTVLKAIPGADLDKAAEIIGTAGTLRRQMERHERDRRAYRAYIDRVKN